MTPEKAYRDLADRVERAERLSGKLDGEIALLTGWTRDGACWRKGRQIIKKPARYTASLDAAMTLLVEPWDHMEVYQPDHQTLGWTVHVFANSNLGGQWSGFAQSHPLALVAAALRLRAHAARIGRVG